MKPMIGILILAALLLMAAPQPAQAQGNTGIIAFVGVDTTGTADIYLLDLASNRTARLAAPVLPDADIAWDPSGQTLAFTTNDGGYGLLRSLRGCFGSDGICADVAYIIPPALVEQLEWSPDGTTLFMLTDEGLKAAPPRTANPRAILNLDVVCDRTIDIAPDNAYLLCAETDAENNIQVSVYEPLTDNNTLEFGPRYEIGTFPDITGYDIGLGGQAVVGTLEQGGDSGFYASVDGVTVERLAPYQVHVYAAAFNPVEASPIAVVGAISDSTGDATLRDGDAAELLFYTIETGELTQVQGFTGATGVTWDPTGQTLLAIIGSTKLSTYHVATNTSTALTTPAGIQIMTAAWSALTNTGTTTLPTIPTATLPGLATAVPTPTAFAFPTPFPTIAPPPTWTPYPTPYIPPSVTPGSPMGTGCQYATAAQPVVVGDTAEVTNLGAGLRIRNAASLTAGLLRELPRGTRMTVLSGPFCADGYRWWQVQLVTDGLTGWVADSEPTGFWIQRAAAATPTMPSESILFMADRYVVNYGQCATIYWSVQGIKEVYYEGQGVTGSEARVECPTSSRTYTLTVVRLDNSTVTNTITINVISVY